MLKSAATWNVVPPVIVTVPSNKFAAVLMTRTLSPVTNAWLDVLTVSVIVPVEAGVADVVEVIPE
jgi:hypothetical protein